MRLRAELVEMGMGGRGWWLLEEPGKALEAGSGRGQQSRCVEHKK